MADDRLKAAFLADLGVANREKLLAAPDTRDVALRGRFRSNGSGNATAQHPNGSGDASVSNWNQFAKHNKENVGDGDLADLHGGQLHRQNREAMGYGNPRPAPTFNRPTPTFNPRPTPASNTRPTPESFPRPSRPHYSQPQDHTPLNYYDSPSPNFQAPAHVQPMANGNGARGGTEDALALARSMQFKGSYGGKGKSGGMRGNASPRGPRGGYGGSDFRGGRGGFEPRTARGGYPRGGPDFRGGRGGYENRGPRGGSLSNGGPGHISSGLGRSGHGVDGYGTGRGNARPSAAGPRGGPAGRVPSSLSSRGREEYNIRGAASGRPQRSLRSNGNREPVVQNGVWTCTADDTEPVYDSDEGSGPRQRPLPVTTRPQQLVSSKEFMSAIMDSKWAPKKP
ncbi:uncharacterized protein J3D65DRAFT_205033 [Phyllosticta citribraziliensis]|uniref:Uncharacterized protein n=1 Tax=Phyllosticta citribraziliensis TaxID=989973 RepID=A0ABR1M3L5_9PEZI